MYTMGGGLQPRAHTGAGGGTRVLFPVHVRMQVVKDEVELHALHAPRSHPAGSTVRYGGSGTQPSQRHMPQRSKSVRYDI